MRFRLLVLLIILWALPSWAATYHVRTGGNDLNSCSTAQTNSDANAKQSIGNAIRNCGGAGHTVLVHGGLYDESFDNGTFYANGGSTSGTFPAGTADNNRFTIEGAPSETVEIRPSQQYGGGVFFNTQRSWVTIKHLIMDSRNQNGGPWKVQIPATHWRLEDVEVRNGSASGLSMGDSSGSPSCDNSCFHEFINVSSHDSCPGCTPSQKSFVHGAYVGCSDNLFSGGEYYANGHGIQSYCDPNGSTPGSPDRNRFIGVKFHHNASTGIGLYYGSNLEIINVLAYDNSGGVVVKTDSAKVYYTTAYNNQNAGISCIEGVDADVRNNISLGNGGSQYESCNNAGADDLSGGNANTLFVSAAGRDLHLANQDNGGVAIGGVTTDLEGRTRNNPPDRGAYEFGAAPPPPTPDPFLIVGRYPLDEGTGTTAADISGNAHTCTLNNPTGAWVAPGIIGPAALNLNGARWCQVTGDSSLRPTSEFCLSGWFRSATPQNCDLASMGDSYFARIDLTGNLAGFYYNGSSWPIAQSTSVNMTDGLTHHWVVTKDLFGLRAWVDRAQVAFTPVTGTINYTLGSNLHIGRHGNGDTAYNCSGVLDQVYVTQGHCEQSDVDGFFTEQVSVTGTSMTHSQFERANLAIGSILATDADMPAHDRTQALALAVAIQRVGSQITQYFALECSRNGGAFTTLTNTFDAMGARIAPDSAVNMGDSVLVTLPTGGFTPVSGRVVADTINSGLTTTLNTGEQTQWRYTIDFGGDAVAGNTYDCRPEGFGASNYLNVKRITLVDPPSVFNLRGVTLRGGTLR